MKKKIKRLVATTIVCVLVASIFGSVMVLAPPPDVVFPALIDVFVTNTGDDPVPVDVTDDTLDVTLDEPIEVTNPSGESLDVDVSGWLHTVSTGILVLDEDLEPDELYWFQIVTEGYRLINLEIIRLADTTWDGRACVVHYLQTRGTVVEAIDFESPYPISSGFLTYEITMNMIFISFRNVGAETIPAGGVRVSYYMTT